MKKLKTYVIRDTVHEFYEVEATSKAEAKERVVVDPYDVEFVSRKIFTNG